jgi:hypothetical protein
MRDIVLPCPAKRRCDETGQVWDAFPARPVEATSLRSVGGIRSSPILGIDRQAVRRRTGGGWAEVVGIGRNTAGSTTRWSAT